MTSTRKLAATAAIATAMLVYAAPTAALAGEPAGGEFGQHVRACAQTMGFTGEHHPGMHHGYAGWNGMTCND